jgi:hypothetical protein
MELLFKNHSLSIDTRMHIIFMMYYTRKIHKAIHTWVGSADNVKIFFRFQKSYSSYNVESDIKWKSQIDYSFINCSRLIFWKILTVARHSVLGVEGLEMWTGSQGRLFSSKLWLNGLLVLKQRQPSNNFGLHQSCNGTPSAVDRWIEPMSRQTKVCKCLASSLSTLY